MPHILKLSQISKVFSQKTLFSHLDYQFEQGQSYALIGPSGAGKSTLLHLLAGFETPTEGEVLVPPHFVQNHLGFIYQVPHLLDELSVAENVMLKGLIAKQSYKECHDKALELLSQVGLADKASQRPRSLSGGEQQRVAVLRALFSDPTFILADEPTAHLDKNSSQLLLDLILSYKNAGIIMVSHDTSITSQLDHILYLSEGTLREQPPMVVKHKEHYV